MTIIIHPDSISSVHVAVDDLIPVVGRFAFAAFPQGSTSLHHRCESFSRAGAPPAREILLIPADFHPDRLFASLLFEHSPA
ncbi:unnamed protein product [Lota lota]